MNEVVAKLSTLGPEITMLIGATLCLALGLASNDLIRRLTGFVALVTLIVAGCLAATGGEGAWDMAGFVKTAIAGVGILLLFVAMAVPERLEIARDMAPSSGPWQPLTPEQSERGEFFGFFLLSLTGAMLCAGAGDLVWLFLALELTSLPTYVLVATSRQNPVAQEAGVKYFFLGAMAAAVFLYGFTLIYGATGETRFDRIAEYVALSGVSPLMTLGLVLALVGVAFKIAAAPMHFYAADVYQGATVPVTAFLAFVPKTAGFVAMIALLRLVGWPLPEAVVWLLWIMAAVTMTVGNVLGLLQTSVKRVLAYSSIAHSGYMLVGLLGSTDKGTGEFAIGSGVAAVLFYLIAYGLATLAAFAVLGCLERRGEEADSFDDLSGLSTRSPGLALIMLLSMLSLIGLPPLVGFVGKIYLFGSAIEHGFVVLVIIAVLNSAISAVYYLRIVGACFFGETDKQTYTIDSPLRKFGAAIAAAGALALGFGGGPLVKAAHEAAQPQRPGITLPSEFVEDQPAAPTQAAQARATDQQDR
jgi:NADH-quinone oxidoreductase subunit N